MVKTLNKASNRENIQGMHWNSKRKEKIYKKNPLWPRIVSTRVTKEYGVLHKCNIYKIVSKSPKY